MQRFLLFILSIIVVFGAAACSAKKVTGDDVVKALIAAHLQADSPAPMTKDDYGLAPYVCMGTQFLITSLGPNAGGRIFICDNTKDRDTISGYFNNLGTMSPTLSTWVYAKDNIVLELDGNLPEGVAKMYEAALP